MSKLLSRTQITNAIKDLVITLTKYEGDSYVNEDITALEYSVIRHLRDTARLAQSIFDEEIGA